MQHTLLLLRVLINEIVLGSIHYYHMAFSLSRHFLLRKHLLDQTAFIIRCLISLHSFLLFLTQLHMGADKCKIL